MKYTLNLDENGYILSIAHTKDDNFELDLEKLESRFLNAYKVVDGALILDKEKEEQFIKEELEEINAAEIEDLQTKLKDTDYIMAQMLEEIMALSNPLTFIADMIKIFANYAYKYKAQLADRKTWRARIKELRGE